MIIGQPPATLRFDPVRSSDAVTVFTATYDDGAFRATLEISDYVTGSPADMFEGMARDWRGWSGQRKWQDLERRLRLSASSDATGHVTIRVELDRNWPLGSLVGEVVVEAGQLGGIANDMRDMFPPHERKY